MTVWEHAPVTTRDIRYGPQLRIRTAFCTESQDLLPGGDCSWPPVTPDHGICRPLLASSGTCTHTHKPVWIQTGKHNLKQNKSLSKVERKGDNRSQGDNGSHPKTMRCFIPVTLALGGKWRREDQELHVKLEAQPGNAKHGLHTHSTERMSSESECPERQRKERFGIINKAHRAKGKTQECKVFS